MSTSRTVRKLAVAASLLPLLAACGSETAAHSAGSGSSSAGAASAGAAAATSSVNSSGQLDIPADASADVKKQYLMENAIAACMKKQGFTYTPEAPDDIAAGYAADGADYALTKKSRQKYGFGYYAGVVYPNDPQAFGSKAAEQAESHSPQSDYIASLTPAQKTAYDKALGTPPEAKAGQKGTDNWTGCLATANKEAFGSDSAKERSAATAAQNQANAQALNGDPKLVSLAQSYASCLRNDGIPVTTTQPLEIADMVKLQSSASVPPGTVSGGAAPAPGGTPVQPMSRDEALPLLTKDIDLAMQDLECGKEFRAAYFPKFLKAPASYGNG